MACWCDEGDWKHYLGIWLVHHIGCVSEVLSRSPSWLSTVISLYINILTVHGEVEACHAHLLGGVTRNK